MPLAFCNKLHSPQIRFYSVMVWSRFFVDNFAQSYDIKVVEKLTTITPVTRIACTQIHIQRIIGACSKKVLSNNTRIKGFVIC